jgi:hypothetical protein
MGLEKDAENLLNEKYTQEGIASRRENTTQI